MLNGSLKNTDIQPDNPLVNAVMLETNANISALTKQQLLHGYMKANDEYQAQKNEEKEQGDAFTNTAKVNLEKSRRHRDTLKDMLSRAALDREFKTRTLGKTYKQRLVPKSRLNIFRKRKPLNQYKSSYDKFLLAKLAQTEGVSTANVASSTPNELFNKLKTAQAKNRKEYIDNFLEAFDNVRAILAEIAETNRKLRPFTEKIDVLYEQLQNLRIKIQDAYEITNAQILSKNVDTEVNLQVIKRHIDTLKYDIREIGRQKDTVQDLSNDITTALQDLRVEIDKVKASSRKNKHVDTRYEHLYTPVKEAVTSDIWRNNLLITTVLNSYNSTLAKLQTRLALLERAKDEKKAMEENVAELDTVAHKFQEKLDKIDEMNKEFVTLMRTSGESKEAIEEKENKNEEAPPTVDNSRLTNTALASKLKKLKIIFTRAEKAYNELIHRKAEYVALLDDIVYTAQNGRYKAINKVYYDDILRKYRDDEEHINNVMKEKRVEYMKIVTAYTDLKQKMDLRVGFNTNNVSSNIEKVVGSISHNKKIFELNLKILEEYVNILVSNKRLFDEIRQTIDIKVSNVDDKNKLETEYIPYVTERVTTLTPTFNQLTSIVQVKAQQTLTQIREKYTALQNGNNKMSARHQPTLVFADNLVNNILATHYQKIKQNFDYMKAKLKSLQDELKKYKLYEEKYNSLHATYDNLQDRVVLINQLHENVQSILKNGYLRPQTKITYITNIYNDRKQYIQQALTNYNSFLRKYNTIIEQLNALPTHSELIQNLQQAFENLQAEAAEINHQIKYVRDDIDNILSDLSRARQRNVNATREKNKRRHINEYQNRLYRRRVAKKAAAAEAETKAEQNEATKEARLQEEEHERDVAERRASEAQAEKRQKLRTKNQRTWGNIPLRNMRSDEKSEGKGIENSAPPQPAPSSEKKQRGTPEALVPNHKKNEPPTTNKKPARSGAGGPDNAYHGTTPREYKLARYRARQQKKTEEEAEKQAAATRVQAAARSMRNRKNVRQRKAEMDANTAVVKALHKNVRGNNSKAPSMELRNLSGRSSNGNSGASPAPNKTPSRGSRSGNSNSGASPSAVKKPASRAATIRAMKRAERAKAEAEAKAEQAEANTKAKEHERAVAEHQANLANRKALNARIKKREQSRTNRQRVLGNVPMSNMSSDGKSEGKGTEDSASDFNTRKPSLGTRLKQRFTKNRYQTNSDTSEASSPSQPTQSTRIGKPKQKRTGTGKPTRRHRVKTPIQKARRYKQKRAATEKPARAHQTGGAKIKRIIQKIKLDKKLPANTKKLRIKKLSKLAKRLRK